MDKLAANVVVYMTEVPASKTVIYPQHLRERFDGRTKRRLGAPRAGKRIHTPLGSWLVIMSEIALTCASNSEAALKQ